MYYENIHDLELFGIQVTDVDLKFIKSLYGTVVCITASILFCLIRQSNICNFSFNSLL